MASHSELRELTAESRGGSSHAVAVHFPAGVDARLRHMTASASDGTLVTHAVDIDGATALVEDATAIASSTSSASGINAHAGATVVVRRTRVAATVVAGDLSGITNGQGDMRIHDSTIEAQGTGNVLGIYVAGFGNVPSSNGSLISNTLVSAQGSADAHAVEVAGGAFAELVNLRASGTGTGMRLRTTGFQSGTTLVRSVGSVYDGPVGVEVVGVGYLARFSGGQIRGGANGAGLKCAFVSDAGFDALTSACTP
jgi:hypothetical protein